MVPKISPKKFRSESVLAGSNTRTSTIGTVNNRAIETDLILILISPYPINHLTGNIPSAAGVYNCGLQIFDDFLQWSGIMKISGWIKISGDFSFPLNNAALVRNICKHNSHFSFFHHPSHEVLWMTGHTERERSASYQNEMKMLHIVEWNETMLQPSSLCYAVPSLKRRFYEARLTAYEAILWIMKRYCVPWSEAFSGFIHHFCLRQKWWRL